MKSHTLQAFVHLSYEMYDGEEEQVQIRRLLGAYFNYVEEVDKDSQ